MIQIITRYGNLLLLAMGQTLLLALCGLFFACILGMFFGLLSVLKNKACRIISSIFVDVIRGVPMIVLAYFIYFGVPYCLNNMMGFSFTLTALQAGTGQHCKERCCQFFHVLPDMGYCCDHVPDRHHNPVQNRKSLRKEIKPWQNPRITFEKKLRLSGSPEGYLHRHS